MARKKNNQNDIKEKAGKILRELIKKNFLKNEKNESEEDEDRSGESQDSVNSEFPASRNSLRRGQREVSVSLEQNETEPVRNLERGIRNAETAQAETEKPVSYAAQTQVQYSGEYEGASYQERRRSRDTEMPTQVTMIRNITEPVLAGSERRIDTQRWQRAMDMVDRGERREEEYFIRAPEKTEREDNFPFQEKKQKRKRAF